MKVTTSRDKASLNVHLQRLVWVSLSVPLVLIGLLVIALVTLRVDQIKTEIKDLSTLMATRVDAQLQAQIQSVQALSTSTPAPNRDDFDRI